MAIGELVARGRAWTSVQLKRVVRDGKKRFQHHDEYLADTSPELYMYVWVSGRLYTTSVHSRTTDRG